MGARRSGHWHDLAGMVFLLLGSFPGAAHGAQVTPVVSVGVRPAAAPGLAPRRRVTDAIEAGSAFIADDAGLLHGLPRPCLRISHSTFRAGVSPFPERILQTSLRIQLVLHMHGC